MRMAHMTNNLATEIRAYNMWVNTFELTPENFVTWRQRDELWQLVSGLMDDDEPGSGWSELSEWWTEHVDD